MYIINFVSSWKNSIANFSRNKLKINVKKFIQQYKCNIKGKINYTLICNWQIGRKFQHFSLL